MNKQVKITIDNKECYCDEEVFKYILRISNKMEELEYNRDKAIEYIERLEVNSIGTPYSYTERGKDLLKILRGENNE